MKRFRQVFLAMSFAALAANLGCGGGGADNLGRASSFQQNMVIVPTNFPIGLQGHPYTATLMEKNGVLPVTWSVDSSTPLPAGLSLDAATGVVSGTPTSSGPANVTFIVTDSSNPPQVVRTRILIGIADPLTLKVQNVQVREYQDLSQRFAVESGGVSPYSFTIAQGTLPPGVKLDPTNGSLVGQALASGTFNVVVAVQDSYSPPEVTSQSGSLIVTGAPLSAGSTMNGTRLILNRPYRGTVSAYGGTPPYTFQISSGTLPPGLSIPDPSNGVVTGTPVRAGSYSFQLLVSDSASASTYLPVNVSVSNALGRNDSPATATPIGVNDTHASISPATDSSGALAPDSDYYKLVAAAGSTVHVETYAKRRYSTSLDTVIELTDLNGVRLTTGCNQPGSATTNFSSPCLNDDISASPHVQDSALDYKVPGTSANQAFLVHVLDWSGTARPDMVYDLSVSGVIEPLKIIATGLPTGYTGVGYAAQVSSSGGTGTITFSVATGSLPPGLAFSSGKISGTTTAPGHFQFTIQAVDQGNPAQKVSSPFTIDVANPVVITSTNLTDGTIGSPYKFQLTSTGGFGPIQWLSALPPSGLTLSSDGILSGTPTQSGTFLFQVDAFDAGAYEAQQQTVTSSVSITIH